MDLRLVVRRVLRKAEESPPGGPSSRGAAVGTVSQRQAGTFVKRAPGEWVEQSTGRPAGATEDTPGTSSDPQPPVSPQVTEVHEHLGHLVDQLTSRVMKHGGIGPEVRKRLRRVGASHLASAIRIAGGRPERGKARMVEQITRMLQARHAAMRRRDAVEHPDHEAIKAAKRRIVVRRRKKDSA